MIYNVKVSRNINFYATSSNPFFSEKCVINMVILNYQKISINNCVVLNIFKYCLHYNGSYNWYS